MTLTSSCKGVSQNFYKTFTFLQRHTLIKRDTAARFRCDNPYSFTVFISECIDRRKSLEMESRKGEKSTKLPGKVEEAWSVIRELAITKPESLHEKIQFLKDPEDVNVTVDQTGEGLMNYIFRLQKNDDSEQRAIVKKTTDWPAKVKMGDMDSVDFSEFMDTEGKTNEEIMEDKKIPLDRVLSETRSLDKFNEILPGTAPQVYMTDVDNHFFIMEDLFKHKVLGKALSEPQLSDEDVIGMVTAVAEAIAAVHRSTHRKTLSPDQFELLHTEIGQYTKKMNEELPAFLKFLYLNPKCPIVRKDLSKRVGEHARSCMYGNTEFEKSIDHIADLLTTRHDCLIHNDFHMGAVMIRHNDAKFIDPEFATVSLPEKDLGQHLADVISFYYIHEGKNPEIAQRFVLAAKTFLECYTTEMDGIIGEHDDSASFFENVSVFTADRIIFRILIPATVPGLDKLPEQEAKAFERGVSLFESMRNIHSINEFMSAAFD